MREGADEEPKVGVCANGKEDCFAPNRPVEVALNMEFPVLGLLAKELSHAGLLPNSEVADG